MKVLMFTCSVCFHLFNVCAYNGYKECHLHQMFVPESLWPILLHHFVMFKLFCRVRKSEGPEDFPSTPGIPARSSKSYSNSSTKSEETWSPERHFYLYLKGYLRIDFIIFLVYMHHVDKYDMLL